MRISTVAKLSLLCTGALLLLSDTLAAEDRVNYNRDIRPILSNTCYVCHGPDEANRQTSLRLDQQDSALGPLETGGFAIIPGNSAESELYRRLVSDDPEQHMPPFDSGKKITPVQIEKVKRWIDEGARWQGHWSFIKPERPAIPTLAEFPGSEQEFPRNPIDHFVAARLQAAGLQPSPAATKETLIRRVTFDLTGLPPTLEEIDAFLADDSANAYEQVVDRLLNSKRYGEHLARFWLDAARYGDTHGLHLDNERSLWPYRDWVINAFNTNMSFDEFTRLQLAGDLLPTDDPAERRNRLVATGFNRCNVTTSEGGSIPEEYRVRYAVDRVETTSTVWLGLTTGCAVCHKHKYDPISQVEFYKLYAYFYSFDENPMDGNALLPPPVERVPSPEQESQMTALKRDFNPLNQRIKDVVAAVEYKEPKATETPQQGRQEFVWIEDELPPGAQPSSSGGADGWKFVKAAEHPVFSGTSSSTRTATGLSQHFFTGANPPLTIGKGDVLFAYVYLDPMNPPKEIMLQFNDGKWEHRAVWGEDVIPWGKAGTASRHAMGPLPKTGEWVRLEVPADQVGLSPGALVNGWAFTQHDGTVYWDKAGLVTETPQSGQKYRSLALWAAAQRDIKNSTLPKPIQNIIKLAADKRKAAQQQQLQNYFVEYAYADRPAELAELTQQRDALQRQIDKLDKEIPRTLVMKDKSPPLETFLLTRGQYDQPDKSQPVQPGVPAALHDLPADAPANRLALADWLIDPANPLTARVTVNRYWQHYFGVGLVKTAEDFGSQGDWPSHPELLDWLATEFIKTGWNVKAMQKLIVMSATYRQSSRVTPELLEKDPENRLLSRGPRFRLDAEMIRDNALTLSELLVGTIGGPSVKPYQPTGLWKAVGYTNSNTANFVQDHGTALYRRSMYTFWKRTSPPPSMSTFDAPSRESCTVQRARTNTPLQALVLMNDVQFIEAARRFAQRIMTAGGSQVDDRIDYAFRLATARHPNREELEVLRNVFQAHLEEYRANQDAAVKLISVGEAPRDESLDAGELAAWTMLSNLILNLNETVTKG